MSTQTDEKRSQVRWTTLKEWTPAILFLIVTTLSECLVILYAISLGLNDTSPLQWSFQFPGTSSTITLAISPLFHLIPICVIATLAFSWTYLTKRVATKKQEIRKGKVETFSRQKIEKKGILSGIKRTVKNFSRKVQSRLSVPKGLSQRMHIRRPAVRSALFVLCAFAAFTLIFSLLAYPKLIYNGVSNVYQTNPGLLNFVNSANNWAKGAAEALGPIGWISKSINNGLLAVAPGVRSLGVGLGDLIKPLASLDNAGKYLVFQDAAALLSAFVILIYGERIGKGYRYKK